MKTTFIGRETEISLLNSQLGKPSASLLVIHGRRRIGKSRLLEEFAKDKRCYRFTGLPPGKGVTAKKQREEFARRLEEYIATPGLKADDWSSLFTFLAKQCRSGRRIIILDEISWMGMKDSTFLGKLKNAWDEEFKKNKNLILILCGSVSTWIEKNILSSTGFVGRINHVLRLQEMPLRDCAKFWNNSINISSFEKFKFLAVSGGIPLYLEAMDPKLTAEENLRQLCFLSGGLLVREFENIFTDLFSKKAKLYKDIVRTLINGPLDSLTISQKLGKNQTGWLSEHINDLEKAGFTTRDYLWDFKTGKDTKISHYRLSDNYVRFYLKYIEKNIQKIERNDFKFRSISSLPGWETILGLQFENLVLKNRDFVRQKLGIKPDEVITDNPYFQNKTKQHSGCQIDYLIQTKFNNLYICEIKFSREPIGTKIIQQIQAKINSLIRPKSFSCRPVLIHVNGVTDELKESDYFSNIISFEKLLSDT